MHRLQHPVTSFRAVHRQFAGLAPFDFYSAIPEPKDKNGGRERQRKGGISDATSMARPAAWTFSYRCFWGGAWGGYRVLKGRAPSAEFRKCQGRNRCDAILVQSSQTQGDMCIGVPKLIHHPRLSFFSLPPSLDHEYIPSPLPQFSIHRCDSSDIVMLKLKRSRRLGGAVAWTGVGMVGKRKGGVYVWVGAVCDW
jgi:hypothetical protein